MKIRVIISDTAHIQLTTGQTDCVIRSVYQSFRDYLTWFDAHRNDKDVSPIIFHTEFKIVNELYTTLHALSVPVELRDQVIFNSFVTFIKKLYRKGVLTYE